LAGVLPAQATVAQPLSAAPRAFLRGGQVSFSLVE
jgi:hypothetical protein